jgi:glycosyltransferase involved in cell wall biosynthesis
LGVGTNGADLVSPPLVSLLIINWNYGTYIGATIDSIKSQDYPAIEVIVVDNGSTDDSRDVIAKHAGDDPRFRVVHLDENLGQLGAYFHAFELTSGEFVTIVDADDILFPSFVSSHVQVHLALPSRVALTTSNVVELRGEGRALTGVYARFGFGVKPATRGLRPADVAPRLRTVPVADYSRLARSTSTVAAVAMPWFWAPGSSNMFRRSVLAVAQQQRKNRVYMRAADNYLNPLCHALGGTALIDVQLSAYRIHGSNYFAVRETVGVLRPGRADFNARVQQENRDLMQFLLERAWLLESLRGSRFWPLLRQLFEQVADRDRFFASPDTLTLFIDYYPNLCQTSGERRLLAELRRLLGRKGLRTVLRAVHGGRIPLRLRVALITERGKTATVAARRIVLKVGRAAASKMARLPSKNISAAKTLAPPKARTKTETETETDEHNPQDFGPVAVLSADPPIFLAGMAFQSMIGIAPAFARSYGSRPAAFLIYPCWTIEDRYRSAEVIAAARAHRDEHPEHELVFLCNSAAETEALASGGLNAQLLNKNFTVSDTVFRPLAEAQVEFDAVYNARFDPRKRHDLASAIERVAYLGYPCLSAGPYEEQSELAARLLRRHPGHALLNPIEHGLPVRLPPESVNAALNRAAVGLCLSSVEGSNYALGGIYARRASRRQHAERWRPRDLFRPRILHDLRPGPDRGARCGEGAQGAEHPPRLYPRPHARQARACTAAVPVCHRRCQRAAWRQASLR